MTDPFTDRDTDETASGMPRWVKVSLIVVGVLIAIFVVLQLAGKGPKHGPGMHRGISSTLTDSDQMRAIGRGRR